MENREGPGRIGKEGVGKRKWGEFVPLRGSQGSVGQRLRGGDVYMCLTVGARSIKIKRLVAALKSGHNGKAEIGFHGLKSRTSPFNLQMERAVPATLSPSLSARRGAPLFGR